MRVGNRMMEGDAMLQHEVFIKKQRIDSVVFPKSKGKLEMF
jgi:hypothetical protein